MGQRGSGAYILSSLYYFSEYFPLAAVFYSPTSTNFVPDKYDNIYWSSSTTLTCTGLPGSAYLQSGYVGYILIKY